MATSLLASPLSLPVIDGRESSHFATHLTKSSFLGNNKLFFAASAPHPRNSLGRRSFRFPVVTNYSFDHVPKQFSEENLADGLMDNFKNVPPALYGLSPSQMGMFMREDDIGWQPENVTEETISSAYSYSQRGMWSMSRSSKASPSIASMSMSTSMSMYRRGGGGRRRGRRRSPPPDLPSHILSGRIIWIGMPLVPAVTELVVAQFMWLDYVNPKKPIYIYFHSSGTHNYNGEVIGAETDAFAIADLICRCKAEVHTVNMGMAYGQSAMLLALGTKGRRHMAPLSSAKLYLPQVNGSGGDTSDMWFMAKELQANTECLLEFLERGIGKPKEEIRRDIEFSKFFMAEDAIEYGIADRVLKRADKVYKEKQKSVGGPMQRTIATGPQEAAAGGR